MLAALVLAVLAPIPQEGAIEILWCPTAGTVLERCLEFEVRGGIAEYEHLLAGLDLRGLAGTSIRGRLRVRDTLGPVEEGRPLVLEREVLELRTTWNGLAELDVAPDLAGRALRYAWDAERDAFERDWARPHPRGIAPPALREDLDLRALLPGRPVRVGEVWRVPVSRAAPLFAPAGGLHVDTRLADARGFDDLARAFDIERGERIRDSEIECLLARVEGRTAVIELGWTWRGAIDPFLPPASDTWLARLAPDPTRLGLDGCAWGRLLWDLEAGHAREFKLEVEFDGLLATPLTRLGIPIRARGMWWVAIESRTSGVRTRAGHPVPEPR
ncbi:MAG TPA: hypothetical protein VMT18_16095 [Planctomycetota bacterium]|nr:hypothetical protein [Planctomycetota bacterium]